MLAPSILTLLVGGLLGLAFGAVARWSAFCVRGAIEDVVSGERLSPRVSAYLVALAVSLVGVQALVLAGLLDAGQVIHLPSGLSLGGTILGGLMFGVGMVLAGGCGARQLVLAGGGNPRSPATPSCRWRRAGAKRASRPWVPARWRSMPRSCV
jgi:uncharacterized membrane protein YedE/YeeE